MGEFKVLQNKNLPSELQKDLIKLLDSGGVLENAEADIRSEVAIVIFSVDSSNKSRNRVVHDLRSGVRTLDSAIESIKNGYKFDDALADLKIESIERAIAQIKKHIRSFEDLHLSV